MTEKKTEHFKHFTNTECEYFPCHKGAQKDSFNCLFCFCPLYALGDACGGNFVFTEEGIKDCSNCIIPHSKGGYKHITDNFNKISKLASNNRKQK